MRLEATVWQQFLITRQTRSETSWWLGREGVDPLVIERVVVIPTVKIYFE